MSEKAKRPRCVNWLLALTQQAATIKVNGCDLKRRASRAGSRNSSSEGAASWRGKRRKGAAAPGSARRPGTEENWIAGSIGTKTLARIVGSNVGDVVPTDQPQIPTARNRVGDRLELCL